MCQLLVGGRMTETEEQVERLYSMDYRERHWRTYKGVFALSGYAKWKAGIIVLKSMIFNVSLGLFISYFFALFAFLPISLIFGIDYPSSLAPSTGSDLAFFAIFATFFFWMMPGQALDEYHRLREDLEEHARKEGTFWRREFWSD